MKTTEIHLNNGNNAPGDIEPLLTPGEVAQIFRVDPKTVTRWAQRGKFTTYRTPGGHRRYRAAEVRSVLNGSRQGQQS